MNTIPTFKPLGDSAILIDFGNIIDEEINDRVIHLFHLLQENRFHGFIEAVPAYSSLAVLYHPGMVRQNASPEMTLFESVVSKIEALLLNEREVIHSTGRKMNIPVCYESEYGPDLPEICDVLNLAPEDIIRLHTSRIYRVYMLGFLPGFPYMGKVEDVLFLPRKNNPVNVRAGSIALAGKQTGIYPLDSPGGWNIIGRTPLTLFSPRNEDPVLFRPGDSITFYPITSHEFENYPDRNT